MKIAVFWVVYQTTRCYNPEDSNLQQLNRSRQYSFSYKYSCSIETILVHVSKCHETKNLTEKYNTHWGIVQKILSPIVITENKATAPKTVLGLSPDEDGFCSSETKHDRRTAPKQNLFILARR
jgi:hypothetical protein